MPRTRPAERLDHLADAAATVFAHKGYRALMADVAAEMGVSQGLLYTYVESKEALFHLVVEHLAGVRSADPDLPLATPLPGETARLVRKALRQGMGMPTLVAALERARPLDVRAEVAAIVRELYRVINTARRLLWVVRR